ncbi:MAG: hypothetical protein WCK38_00300, partial [Candidatus Omnitrophota bacterium]
MNIGRKSKPVFKIIATAVVFSFLWQQVVWAGDLAGITLDKLNDEQSRSFAPQYLKNQQAIHEGLIAQKQAIEDGTINAGPSLSANLSASDTTPADSETGIKLQGPKRSSDNVQAMPEAAAETPQESVNDSVLSVTTASGDVIHYKNGAIDYIEKKDASGNIIIIKRITGLDFVDADNNLLNAEIIYPDGTSQIITDGKVVRITKPDGTVFNYNDEERISSIVYPDNSTVTYSYIKDDAGNILETILTDPEKTSYYDNDNKLTKVIFNNGKIIEYDNGILSRAVDTDGTTYLYEST